MTANQRRIQAALPRGAMMLRRACELAGYDPRTVAADPTDEQTDRIIAAIHELTVSGEVAAMRARNATLGRADEFGDGARYVDGRS